LIVNSDFLLDVRPRQPGASYIAALLVDRIGIGWRVVEAGCATIREEHEPSASGLLDPATLPD
jgi:hypothetical protein